MPVAGDPAAHPALARLQTGGVCVSRHRGWQGRYHDTKRLAIVNFAHRPKGCAEAASGNPLGPHRVHAAMSVARNLLLRMFGRPHGLLGRLGGAVMARTNGPYAAWVVDLLDVQPHDAVLDVGFGPGTAIQLLARSAKCVRGVDPSAEMLRQASARNASAIDAGRVELHKGTADRLPFPDGCFDKAIATNSMQVWPDAVAGLREIGRVLKSGGRLALAFSSHSGQRREGVSELVAAAEFADSRIVAIDWAFCVLATKR